jgi:8-oxo-dGTP pyrophosphatase MutT (NUDIX family)
LGKVVKWSAILADQSAALPYRIRPDGRIEVLLVTSRGKGRWILPKGKVKPGLSPSASAAKEAYEEAGVSGRIDSLSIASFAIAAKADAPRFPIFPLLVEVEAIIWPEMFQRQRRWMDLDEAIATLNNRDVRSALKCLASTRQLLLG